MPNTLGGHLFYISGTELSKTAEICYNISKKSSHTMKQELLKTKLADNQTKEKVILTECILGGKRMAIMSSSSIGRLITLA
jgi:hypothetical protein